jgi:transposase
MNRQFDETFKRAAVANGQTSGKSAAVVAKELGLSPDHLYGWKQDFARVEAGSLATGGPADLPTRLDNALRELARVTEQRDILKKTLGILSEPPPNAISGLKP